jgi:uncharacterized membrane protein YiaA
MAEIKLVPQKPTAAFIGASWLVLLIGMFCYLIGLWNASEMQLSEKGYYFTILLFGLFSVISIQKTIRDRAEDVPVTNIYYGVAWLCVIISIGLLAVGLWNSSMQLSEKGFYGLAMVLSLFAVIAVQKNVRDLAVFDAIENASGAKPRPTTPAPISAPAPQRPDFNAPQGPRV